MLTPFSLMGMPTSEKAASGGCRDLPFGILFVLNVAAIIALMVSSCVTQESFSWCMSNAILCLFPQVIYGIDSLKSSSDSDSSRLMSADDTKVVIGIALGMAVVAVILALAMVKLIVAYARCMILFVLWFNVVISFAFAAYGFAIGNIFVGVIGLLIALLNLCYARAVQHRIPFAVANLRVAAAAISKHWSTYIVSIAFTIVQIVWVVVWALALLGVANNLKKDTSSTSTSTTTTNSGAFYKDSAGNYVAYFFMLLSFYWGLQVRLGCRK
jgi:hypothetical protein